MYTDTASRTAPRSKRRKRALVIIIIIILALLLIYAFSHRSFLLVQYCRIRGYPDNLVSLLERNPETRDFVLAYRDQDTETEAPPEVTKGEIPLFLQWDRRWGYERYGSDMIAITGCGPTCMSMVWCGLTGDNSMTPDVMAEAAEGEGYYVAGSGTSWSFMTDGAYELGLTVQQVWTTPESLTAALESGKVLICSMVSGDFTTDGHFIVLSGIDEDGKIIVRDPNSILRSSHSWDAEVLSEQMAAAWEYSI